MNNIYTSYAPYLNINYNNELMYVYARIDSR